MLYIANAFSLSMLSNPVVTLDIEEISVWEARDYISANVDYCVSCIGHADTAELLTGILNSPIAFNRVAVKLSEQDAMLVAQYNGPRLPEGTTTLPEGAYFTFYKVNVVHDSLTKIKRYAWESGSQNTAGW